MDQAYLISLVEGFYPFGKRSKTETKKQESSVHSEQAYQSSAGVTGNLPVTALDALKQNTGVSRYLSARPIETGVAKYVKKSTSSPISGVGKYLVLQSIKGREVSRVTGVSKYLARFDNDAPPSGVAKYVAGRILKSKYLPKRTTVGKYITRQEIAEAKLAALTGVAKYNAEQERQQRKIAAQRLIERYREEEARLAAEKAAAAAATPEACLNEFEPIETGEAISETGVGRYVQAKANIDAQKPSISKVSKYIALQVVRDSLKPRQSGVAKYIAKSHVYKPKPTVSTVAKYLETQAHFAKTKPTFSGVAKYLIKQRISTTPKPVRASGVEKYLAHLTSTSGSIPSEVGSAFKREFTLTGVAKYLQDRNNAAEVLERSGVPEEICLEGEFIPAAEVQESGDQAGKVTRVSKYINEHQASAKKGKAGKKPTRVDRYLLQSV